MPFERFFYFLQPKKVLWTTRKQRDSQDSRKVHCNWNLSFLLAWRVLITSESDEGLFWKSIINDVFLIFQKYIRLRGFYTPLFFLFIFYLFFPINSLLCFDFSANTTLEEYLISDGIIFNLDSLIAVAMDLISAIQHLEQKGVVHNNITTSSVLIGKGFRVS